jgi:tetratricopeptide (TPR) repeat protein
MMARDTVPRAMSQAFELARGTLAERMMAALDAAEGQGGDVRGRQSAAMVVVAAHGEPWRKRIDLRVEDHERPIHELHRLLHLRRAYELADEADQLLAAGDADGAGARYEQAQRLAPESDELLFWAGLARAHAGDLDAGVDAVRRAAAINPGWLTLLERLPPDFAPAAAAVAAALRV